MHLTNGLWNIYAVISLATNQASVKPSKKHKQVPLLSKTGHARNMQLLQVFLSCNFFLHDFLTLGAEVMVLYQGKQYSPRQAHFSIKYWIAFLILQETTPRWKNWLIFNPLEMVLYAHNYNFNKIDNINTCTIGKDVDNFSWFTYLRTWA